MQTVVISLGGSLLVPKTIDKMFLFAMARTIERFKSRYHFVICTGGGHIAREYITAVKENGVVAEREIGIAVTRVNALLLSMYLKGANKHIPDTLHELKDIFSHYNPVVFGGLEIGNEKTTSDGTSATVAREFGARVLINMTNVSGLYTKDPGKYKNAKKIPQISHEEFKKFFKTVKEGPGQHFVLDRLAADICREAHISVIILKGTQSLEQYLSRKKFQGTIIS